MISLRYVKPIFSSLKTSNVKPKHLGIVFCVGATSLYLYETFGLTSIQIETASDLSDLAVFQDLKYIPTPFIPHRFLQQVYATQLEQPIHVQFERQLFKLSDGGQLALDWLNRNLVTNKPLVLITHGLTGGSDSNYIKDAAKQLEQQGYQVVCFNQRGVAGCELLTPKYHFHGCTQDFKEVIQYLETLSEGREIFGLGFSIGANLMLKYAGEEGDTCKIKRIVSVANPYNLLTCSDNILKVRNWIYDWSITKNFKWLLQKHTTQLQENEKTKGIQISQALNAKNTWEFDELITRRLFDFDSPRELYLNIGCEDVLQNIRVPVVCIHAKDDPIIPPSAIPMNKLKQNKNISLLFTNKGSHVEWFSGLQPQRWIMKPIVAYFRQFAQ